jgi:hypothetical protein
VTCRRWRACGANRPLAASCSKEIEGSPELLAGVEMPASAIVGRPLHDGHVLDIEGRGFRPRGLELPVSGPARAPDLGMSRHGYASGCRLGAWIRMSLDRGSGLAGRRGNEPRSDSRSIAAGGRRRAHARATSQSEIVNVSRFFTRGKSFQLFDKKRYIEFP